MKVIETRIPDVLLLEPKVFGDDRGFFYESFNAQKFEDVTGVKTQFVQDNHSKSVKHVLRGLHYQTKQVQGKLVRAIQGEVFDVAVDVRKSSPTYGQWVGEVLSADNKRMMWVPPGFAHGFLVMSDTAEFLYKTTDFYAPEHEQVIVWNDPTTAIEWPLDVEPSISSKDAEGSRFEDAVVFD